MGVGGDLINLISLNKIFVGCCNVQKLIFENMMGFFRNFDLVTFCYDYEYYCWREKNELCNMVMI